MLNFDVIAKFFERDSDGFESTLISIKNVIFDL